VFTCVGWQVTLCGGQYESGDDVIPSVDDFLHKLFPQTDYRRCRNDALSALKFNFTEIMQKKTDWSL